MSHTSAIKAIKITSITALQAAVSELATSAGIRCRLTQDATPRAYFSNQAGMGKADYVLTLDDAPYDVGFYRQGDGSYEARTDFWGNHIERILGGKAVKPENAEQARMGKLFQLYSVHALTEQARRKGHSVRRQVKDDGTISLVVTGANL